MPSRSDGTEPSTRRSRSRRRSRHRGHHRHHSSRSRTRVRVKNGEKNFLAAVCNMLAIVLLCASLTEPKWITLSGGGCQVNDEPLNHLGTYQFFYPGKILSEDKGFGDGNGKHIIYQFGPDLKDQMDNCVNYKAALLMKTVIAFCFLAILSSLAGFILDLTVPQNRPAQLLQRNAIPSIITVIQSVVINLFCYWLATEVEILQTETKPHPGSKVLVDFAISFYVITAAGGLSVLATAFNCLRRYPLYEDSQGESLLDEYEGLEALLPPPPAPDRSLSPNSLPAPPAYSP